MGQLFYGDNLYVLRESIKEDSVDLIYLDPPFNSKRDYNLLFKSPKGHDSDAQITAFEDSWHWGEQAEREFDEIIHGTNTDLAQIMPALRSFLGENDMMAYLTMMANRLIELHRVLKATGSLYLHCDPTASHYLKIVLDGVFGTENFVNDISWKRTTTKSDYTQGAFNWPRIHDVLLYYAKDSKTKPVFIQPFAEYGEEYVRTKYRHFDPDGRKYRLDKLTAPGMGMRGHPQYEFLGVTRYWVYNKEKMEKLFQEGRVVQTSPGTVAQYKRYLDEVKGVAIGDTWDDISAINSMADERLGYPTQKPLVLLERIISASSNEGDVVLDPFCGCGTAVHAAQKLKRQWVGIDITHLAISLIEKRLKDAFGEACIFDVHGTPKDLDAARDLASRDKYQFQWWAVSLVEAQPFQGKKKGADGGIDGLKFFRDIDQKEARKIVVSVKGGGLKADDVRALNHVREREKAEIGLFISLDEPTAGMGKDAASTGFYTSGNGKMKVPRIQLLTIGGLLSGTQRAKHPDYLPDMNFKKASKEANAQQKELL